MNFRARVWPLLRFLMPSVRVGPLEVVDVGLMSDSMDRVRQLFDEAVRYIEAAGLTKLLSDNLRRVGLVGARFEGIDIGEGKYGTTLEGHEGRNSFYLACRLVWVASYIKVSRDDKDQCVSSREKRDCAFQTVADFAAQYPEGEQWVSYFERIRIRDLNR